MIKQKSYFNKKLDTKVFYEEEELVKYLNEFLKFLNNFKDKIELNLFKETSENIFGIENKLELDKLTGENILNMFNDRDTIVINIKDVNQSDVNQSYEDRTLFIEKFYKKPEKLDKVVYILHI